MARSALPALLRRAAEALGVLLFALLALTLLIQVGARFVLGLPLPWTDEAAVVLYLWAILWTAALVCREREHVAFDLLYQGSPPALRRAMALLGALLVGSLCAWALPASLDYILFMRRESSAVLGLPMHLVYAPFALLLAALVLRSLWRVAGLLGRRWRALLDESA
jgi:TRAP-type C4-dicarboxylate transport system permease small subunit